MRRETLGDGPHGGRHADRAMRGSQTPAAGFGKLVARIGGLPANLSTWCPKVAGTKRQHANTSAW